MNLAPVIVFNYNRPDHSRQTWDELAKNVYASDTELFLYCDGPKAHATQEVQERIAELQNMAKEYAIEAKDKGLFKNVYVIASDTNKGLANSIIGGVTDVINKYGKAIILEDDLLTSPYFLKYMNEALDYYEKYPAVFSISANRPPKDKMIIPDDYEYDVFVSLRSFSTGWATWKSKWNLADWSLDYLDDYLSRRQVVKAFERCGDDMTEMLLMQRDHKIDSWAIRYSFAHFLHHAVAILPCNSYVDNIGFDGTGIHSGKENNSAHRNNLSLSPSNPRFVPYIYEDSRIINAFYNVYCRTKRPIWQKAINHLMRQIGKKPVFTIKKKIYNI